MAIICTETVMSGISKGEAFTKGNLYRDINFDTGILVDNEGNEHKINEPNYCWYNDHFRGASYEESLKSTDLSWKTVTEDGTHVDTIMDEYDKCGNYDCSEIYEYNGKFYNIDWSNGSISGMIEVTMTEEKVVTIEKKYFDMDGDEIQQF